MPLRSAIKSDTYRISGDFNWGYLLKGIITNRNFRVIFTMRLCQAAAASGLARRILLPFCQLLHGLTTHSAATDLSWRTQIGPGLAINHGWGLVVSSGAVIGKNVTLFHGVTIGQRDRILSSGERSTDFPVIEDEVWVGPHAIIVGGVRIGRGSRIAGGAFISRDVPAYSVVSGNPHVIIKTGCVPDMPNFAPPKF